MDDMPALRPGEPEEAGLSRAALERAARLLAAAVEHGRITAGTLLVARRGVVALSRGYGRLTPEPGSPPVAAGSVFLLASITKPVTACALMLLVDAGEVSLDDPVHRYLPAFRSGGRGAVRVRHLLSHTSGLPDMLPEDEALRRAHAPLADFVRGALRAPLRFLPGTGFGYQSMGLLLAAQIVEQVAGRRLPDVVRETLCEPLGMASSVLGLGHLRIEDTVWCGTQKPEPADRRDWGHNSPYWRALGNPWGGVHGSAPDLARLLQMMLDGGGQGGRRVLSPAAARAMTTDQNRRLAAPWGLGWALAISPAWNFFGDLASPATFGHVGATGTVAWADPHRSLLCVILTNRLVDHGSLLRRISNAVWAAVVGD